MKKNTFTLGEIEFSAGNSDSRITRHKWAFTLAEVLITLGIIGIVAALTIPTLMAKITEKQTVSKVKRVYSMLNEAYKLAIPEEGDASGWSDGAMDDPTTAREFFSHLRPYLKIVKDCGSANNGCISPGKLIELSGNERFTYGGAAYYYKALLLDGTSFWLRANNNCSNDATEQNVCALIWVDINGAAPPFQLGKDVFVFYVKPTGVIPHNASDCSLTGTGFSCAKYIIDNGNMDYLHE